MAKFGLPLAYGFRLLLLLATRVTKPHRHYDGDDGDDDGDGQ